PPSRRRSRSWWTSSSCTAGTGRGSRASVRSVRWSSSPRDVGPTSRDRGGLADRGGQAHRRADADRGRRGRRGGPGAGCAGRRPGAEARVPFEVPRGAALAGRLSSVLEVIYLVFNEGYSATAGEDWVRPALCDDALRLGRILAELMPDEPEVHALVALMEIQAS